MSKCSVPQCERDAIAKGLCVGHYQRMKKHGDVQAHLPITKSRPGSKNSHWKGGVMMDRGRVRVYQPGHPNADRHGYVYRYRLVMENKLGRYLRRDEIVHHRGEVNEDVPEKLDVMRQSEHARLHFAKTETAMVLRIRELGKTIRRGTMVDRKKISKLTGVSVRRVSAILNRETWRNL